MAVRRRVLLGLVPFVLVVSALAVPAPALAAVAGLTDNTTSRYEVRPDKGVVHVTVTITMHNSKRNTVESCGPFCTRTISYYWNTWHVVVEAAATNVTATSNAGRATMKTEATTEYWRTILVRYPPVYYGQTRTLTVSYDIPGAPRSSSPTRVSPAYASFCVASTGYTKGTVSVVLPSAYSTAFTSGSSMTTSTSGGTTTLASGVLTDPGNWYSCIEATNSNAFATTTVTAEGHTFQLRAWPEDATWATKVGGAIASEVGGLGDLFGLPLPSGTIVVQEAADAQLLYGSGSFNAKTLTATVGEDAEPATVANQLSRMWFNSDLMQDTWMYEGFAKYAERIAAPGAPAECLEPGAYPGAGGPNLAAWIYPNKRSGSSIAEITDYQYRAACWIVSSLATDVGPSGLKSVLAAAAGGQIAYLGAAAPEKAPLGGPPVGARGLLDLFDEIGMIPAGVTNLDKAQELFARYGILSDNAALKARSDARAAYHKLQADAGGWALPIAVRRPMAGWDFAAAQQAIASLNQIVTLRDQIGAANAKVPLDAAIKSQFEAAADQQALDGLVALLQKELAAVNKVGDATKAFNADRSLFQTVGLLDRNLKGSLDEANAALAAFKPDDATASANEVTDAVGTSSDTGTQRLAIVLGSVLAVALLLAVVLVLRRRSRTKARRLAAAEAAIGMTVEAPGSPIDTPVDAPVDALVDGHLPTFPGAPLDPPVPTPGGDLDSGSAGQPAWSGPGFTVEQGPPGGSPV